MREFIGFNPAHSTRHMCSIFKSDWYMNKNNSNRKPDPDVGRQLSNTICHRILQALINQINNASLHVPTACCRYNYGYEIVFVSVCEKSHGWMTGRVSTLSRLKTTRKLAIVPRDCLIYIHAIWLIVPRTFDTETERDGEGEMEGFD